MKYVMELRWDPILGEWVLISDLRSRRPWRPDNFCPFCPGMSETGSGWDVLILENKFPMLKDDAPKSASHEFYVRARALGRCYVLVETPIHDIDDISDLSIENIAKIINEVKSLTYEVLREGRYVYLLWFRNKGKEVGVSLTHPHSQIYVLPFIPAKVIREISNARNYWIRNKSCIFCDILKTELKDAVRIVYKSKDWIAFIPFFAHWPFEVHVYLKRHAFMLPDLNDSEVKDLSLVLKKVLCGIKNLFSKPSPYVMVLHQAPLKGKYPYYHIHIEIYGIMRSEGLLKHAGGMELGGGNFTYDSTPEHNAEVLRKTITKYC